MDSDNEWGGIHKIWVWWDVGKGEVEDDSWLSGLDDRVLLTTPGDARGETQLPVSSSSASTSFVHPLNVLYPGVLYLPVFLLFWHTCSQREHIHINSLLMAGSQRHTKLSLSSFSQNLLYLSLQTDRIQSVIYLFRRGIWKSPELSLSLPPTYTQKSATKP